MNSVPFGSWPSPVGAESIASGGIRVDQLVLDGDDVFWTEQRPSELGRVAIVRCSVDGKHHECLPPPFSARSKVHEYGGGAFTVCNGRVWFCNQSDQRIYQAGDGRPIQPLTPEGPLRFADLVVDDRRERLIAVTEDHGAPGEPENTLHAIRFDGTLTRLAEGHDFFAAPRISPDGRHMAWLTWDHPNMPWDRTTLWVAEFTSSGTLTEVRAVVDGAAICQPQWSPEGGLHFVSDRSGWWNLYRVCDTDVEPLCPMEAEFGLPMWTFGQSSYGFCGARRIAAAYALGGRWRLALLDLDTGGIDDLATDFCAFGCLRAADQRVVFVAGSSRRSRAVTELNIETGRSQVFKRANPLVLDDGYISCAEPVAFATADGMTGHAFYYPPVNHDIRPPSGERPPLLVMSHGGPTGATDESFALSVQFWTTRGFAVLDVNYRGSTGYGSAYRRSLNSGWGVADVDDCCNGALWLAEQGLADRERLAIRGGSAGGYTTLCALTFRDVFRAGASYYGIGDLSALVAETHKFESRYDQSLIGPSRADDKVFRERSPIHHLDGLSCPVILFQGTEDKVVPQSQAESMVAALRAKNLPVAYLAFDGEGHGFRQAANIRRALEAELYFYGRVFGFTPADAIEPIHIENMD